jgi:hypothetical protein
MRTGSLIESAVGGSLTAKRGAVPAARVCQQGRPVRGRYDDGLGRDGSPETGERVRPLCCRLRRLRLWMLRSEQRVLRRQRLPKRDVRLWQLA